MTKAASEIIMPKIWNSNLFNMPQIYLMKLEIGVDNEGYTQIIST